MKSLMSPKLMNLLMPAHAGASPRALTIFLREYQTRARGHPGEAGAVPSAQCPLPRNDDIVAAPEFLEFGGSSKARAAKNECARNIWGELIHEKAEMAGHFFHALRHQDRRAGRHERPERRKPHGVDKGARCAESEKRQSRVVFLGQRARAIHHLTILCRTTDDCKHLPDARRLTFELDFAGHGCLGLTGSNSRRSSSRPRNAMLSTGSKLFRSASRRLGSLWSSVANASRPSSRASGAPRQKCVR
jgi:hypothetical protein